MMIGNGRIGMMMFVVGFIGGILLILVKLGAIKSGAAARIVNLAAGIATS